MSDVRNILNALDAINENTVPRPSREGWWADENSTAIGLQVYNQTTYRGEHPFVIVDRGGQVTRIWLPTAKGQAEIKAEYPNAVVYASGTEANPQPQNTASNTASNTADDYKDNLANFVASDERGLANNPEATGAITELNTRLSTLGFSEVASSTVYDTKTVNTVRALQQAYNNMYGEQRIKVDGDLGPRTFRALTEVEDLLKRFNRQTQTFESFKSAIAKYIIKEEVTQITGDTAGILTQILVALDKFYQSATTNGLTISPDLQQRLINARLSLATHTIDVTREITPYISTISNGAVERSKEQTATADSGGTIKIEPEANTVRSVGGGETGAETGGETGAETGAKVTVPQANGGETGAETGGETGAETGGETGAETGAKVEPEVFIPPSGSSDNPRPTENADGDDPYGIINARQQVEAGQVGAQARLDRGLAELKADQDAWDAENSSGGETSGTETNGTETKEYTTLVDAQLDTTLETGDIVIINGKEAEVYADSVAEINVLFWPGTEVGFDPDDNPPAESKGFESFDWGTRRGDILTITTASAIPAITITKENGQINMSYGESKYTDVQLTRNGILNKPRTYSAIYKGERKNYVIADEGRAGRQYGTNLLDAFAYVYNNMLDDA